MPAPPMVITALKEWKLTCPRRNTGKLNDQGEAVFELDLVFPNGQGNIEGLNNIVRRGLQPIQIAVGVWIETEETDNKGKRSRAAKYPGIHALRHFYASWCINRKEDGSLGLPPKIMQERMGHSTITMTMDIYGHLFPRGNDAEEMAAAQRSLLA